jgi:hypothetical protein
MKTKMKIIAVLVIFLTIITSACVSNPPARVPDKPASSEPVEPDEAIEPDDTADVIPENAAEVKISEMSRLNASQPVYHLLILDRIYSSLNSDISDTDNIQVLYKYKHGRNGYLVALYKSSAMGPVFPQLPEKSRVMADLVSVRVNTIREYIRSSAFRRFVTNRRVFSGIDAVLRGERSGGPQVIASASDATTNEMPRLNASQPVYHLLILDKLRSPVNSDISDTGNIQVLYKYKHGKDGYLIALYKSAAGGPVFPQLPEKSRILADLMSVRASAIRRYIRSSAFRKFVTNRRIISDMDAVLLKE